MEEGIGGEMRAGIGEDADDNTRRRGGQRWLAGAREAAAAGFGKIGIGFRRKGGDRGGTGGRAEEEPAEARRRSRRRRTR
jgi:hypothetical protein